MAADEPDATVSDLRVAKRKRDLGVREMDRVPGRLVERVVRFAVGRATERDLAITGRGASGRVTTACIDR